MPPKAKIPAPIDRPLSRAYLREFSGWSTAYPPGLSEPTSLRVMENAMVNRDGSLRVRPGLRYLSYDGGAALARPVVGTHESFFLNDGSRAYLFAVREVGGAVGFRVLHNGEVKTLAEVGFSVPQGSALNFSSSTTYVKYLQIDNKILALSNAGEPIRLFYVGTTKEARRIYGVDKPAWNATDKLTVVHPDAAWITSGTTSTRTNLLRNPSFETNTNFWSALAGTISRSTAEKQVGAASLRLEATVADQIVVAQSDGEGVVAGQSYAAAVELKAGTVTNDARVGIAWHDGGGALISVSWSALGASSAGAWTRLTHGATAPAGTATARVHIELQSVEPGDYHYADAVMLEQAASAGTYFDGSTNDSSTLAHSWSGTVHLSRSTQTISPGPATHPTAETRQSNTLISSDGSANQYNYGFFYTFANEIGESAASQVTVEKAKRAWTAWMWETPDSYGQPSGTATQDPERAADQLVASMPQSVFDQAMAQSAKEWRLYMLSWSNQDPAPVEALLVAKKTLTPTSTYAKDGWLRVTPQSAVTATEAAPIPTETTRHNYTVPPSAAQGVVAADRLVLVNDPAAPGVIRWTSSRTGEYLNFSASRGGGFKTLTSGNLYVPAAVKLWQNPQSVDTLTILCLGVDGYSTSYYMAPGQVTSQTDATSFMGFEETTATPGTVSPFGCEVLNNALYHPLENELMKSTASNYNISHKTMTDLIQNLWSGLVDKGKIVSSQLDNRLYYVVHNPRGAVLEAGCWGNEIWVCDTGVEGGSWSRWLVQAQALRKIEVDGDLVMSVVRPDGIFVLDPDRSLDEYVAGSVVASRPIDWKVETNTQGANRAHDAWAHLQQVNITLGNFSGRLRYGVRGVDLHGRAIDVGKETRDTGAAPADGLPWDIEDQLLVRADMKEWHLYVESLPGVASAGQVNLVQYRYTPVSVNVGYEHGSVETFEYARNVATGNNAVSTNGVPNPLLDSRRP